MPRSSKKKHPHAATLADVGREAGVSAMAASAVLNGARTSSRISPETRARILEASARLQYRPNAAARALIRRRMNTLGVASVVSDGNLNHYFLEVLNGVLETAARHGQNITVFTLEDWRQDVTRLAGFCDGRIDGMILVGPLFDADIAARLPAHTPFVSIHANTPLPGIPDLESDEEAGAFAAVSRLAALGHRRILHLAGPEGLSGPARRLAGYRRALETAGLAFDPALVGVAGFTEFGGRDALRAWFAAHSDRPLPSAVFCANDGVGTGCLEALAAAGLRVPEDVSVVGFDDTLAARTTLPQLTTVRQPLRRMGAGAVELLLEQLRLGTTVPPPIFPTEFILRASVSAPPCEALRVPATA
jgi:LacI family transcriptional regulator